MPQRALLSMKGLGDDELRRIAERARRIPELEQPCKKHQGRANHEVQTVT